MNTNERHPIGEELTRDYFKSMLSKTEDIVPVSNIEEVRISRHLAKQIMTLDKVDIDPDADTVGPKDWPLVEGQVIIFDIKHPKNLVTITREDGLQVSFPVKC